MLASPERNKASARRISKADTVSASRTLALSSFRFAWTAVWRWLRSARRAKSMRHAATVADVASAISKKATEAVSRATAGRRRHQRHNLSPVPTGRAWIGSSCKNRFSSSLNAFAVA
jgi:hypothetical protein